ncbi:hypothetical protein HYQ46_000335 [Verticillium longisporum]|nr:hypothetical protein HYQ46_000335 [Verticillium longisporum]
MLQGGGIAKGWSPRTEKRGGLRRGRWTQTWRVGSRGERTTWLCADLGGRAKGEGLEVSVCRRRLAGVEAELMLRIGCTRSNSSLLSDCTRGLVGGLPRPLDVQPVSQPGFLIYGYDVLQFFGGDIGGWEEGGRIGWWAWAPGLAWWWWSVIQRLELVEFLHGLKCSLQGLHLQSLVGDYRERDPRTARARLGGSIVSLSFQQQLEVGLEDGHGEDVDGTIECYTEPQHCCGSEGKIFFAA